MEAYLFTRNTQEKTQFPVIKPYDGESESVGKWNTLGTIHNTKNQCNNKLGFLEQ